MDDHALAVDVDDLQIQSFLTAKPGAVVEHQQRSMLDVHLCIEQGADFFTAPDCGELAPHLGLDDFLIEPLLLQCPRIEELQRRPSPLDRNAWLNPPGLAEEDLEDRTLTKLYNQRPTWLDNAHRELDHAVFAAYGWLEDPAKLPEQDLLARLLAMNQQRAAAPETSLAQDSDDA